MRKRIAAFMAVVCMVFCVGKMTSLAAVNAKYCGQCNAVLSEQGESVTGWTQVYSFTKDGKKQTCTENYSVMRMNYVCPNGHGVVLYYLSF